MSGPKDAHSHYRLIFGPTSAHYGPDGRSSEKKETDELFFFFFPWPSSLDGKATNKQTHKTSTNIFSFTIQGVFCLKQGQDLNRNKCVLTNWTFGRKIIIVSKLRELKTKNGKPLKLIQIQNRRRNS